MYSKEYNLLALHKVLIIDIGGFTLDYMILRYGEPDTNGFDTLERGVIPMYNSIVHRVRNQSNHLLEEVDVDMIIMGENTVFSEDVCALALSVTEEYVVNTLGVFREIGIDFNTLTTIFVGGGSMLLKDMIRKVWSRYSGKYYIVNDPFANA